MLETTNTVLLQGLTDPANDSVWTEFVGRYRPILVTFAGKLGLHPDDAADVAQETLTTFVEEYREGRYDRDRGRLRSWLLSIARTRIAGVRREQSKRRGQRGESVLQRIPDPESWQGLWEEEWQQAILRAALAELHTRGRTDPQTLRAFKMTTFEQRPAAEVAEELGMTVNAVYLAKHHALERLRGIVARLEDEF